MNWVAITLILCMFGCLKDFRPSESFVTDYLTGPWKNFTDLQVNQDIYPVSTYSYFATLVVVFLITDIVRYKPIILLCGVAGVITFLLIILGQSILSLQIVEFFYGLFLSTEVAYYTYIYAKVEKKHYQEVTGYTKAAALVGRCMSGVVAQLTASFNLLDYHQLNYLTVTAFVLATIWALFLPSVGQSIYFHRSNISCHENMTCASTESVIAIQQDNSFKALSNSYQNLGEITPKTSPSFAQKLRKAYLLLWKDFLAAFTNLHVIKWSAWWAFSTCGYLQVTSYIQLLWRSTVSPNDKIYNGAVDAMYTIIGAVTVFCIGKIPLNWPVIGDVSLSIFSFLEGILLLLCTYTYNIWLLYVMYIAFGVIYHTMVTVASFEVAKYISEDSYGLIFGINTFLALLLQSLLTLIVLNGSLALDIRAQYCVYGGYFVALGILFTLMAIVTIIEYRRRGDALTFWQRNEHNIETTTKISENRVTIVDSETPS